MFMVFRDAQWEFAQNLWREWSGSQYKIFKTYGLAFFQIMCKNFRDFSIF